MVSWNREALAWAAGLFEGEGSFSIVGQQYARMALSSTDEDVVRKFHSVVGLGNVSGPYRKPVNSLGNKPFWQWKASKFEHVQALVAALWPFLCSRRKDRAAEVLRLQAVASEGVIPMARRTHCKQGHEYSERNTYRWNGGRYCRACLAQKARRLRAVRRVAG
jgi:hypothetical protein